MNLKIIIPLSRQDVRGGGGGGGEVTKRDAPRNISVAFNELKYGHMEFSLVVVVT